MEKKLNILIVSTARYRSNGMSNVIKNLYCNDTFSNKKLVFLLPEGSDDIMIDELKTHNFRVVLSNRRKKTIVGYFNLIKKIIKSENIDIIHIHGNSHTLAIELSAAKSAGCKIRIAHAHSTSCRYQTLHKLLTPIFNKSYTHGFACGKAAGEFMYGIKPFTVINNGIDTARYAYDEESRLKIRAKYNLENKFVIGHVGGFNDVKNQSFLIDILKVLLNNSEKYCLMLVGDGKNQSNIRNKAAQLGVSDSVIFAGVTKDVPEYLSACDLIVMPSLFEGFPLTLVEEQANGLKCICSDTITKDVNLTGNVSFISLNESPEVWANAIRNTVCFADRNKASTHAIMKIKEAGYSIEDEVLKLEQYYLKAIRSVKKY